MSESPLSFIWLGSVFDTRHVIAWPYIEAYPNKRVKTAAWRQDWEKLNHDWDKLRQDVMKVWR